MRQRCIETRSNISLIEDLMTFLCGSGWWNLNLSPCGRGMSLTVFLSGVAIWRHKTVRGRGGRGVGGVWLTAELSTCLSFEWMVHGWELNNGPPRVLLLFCASFLYGKKTHLPKGAFSGCLSAHYCILYYICNDCDMSLCLASFFLHP